MIRWQSLVTCRSMDRLSAGTRYWIARCIAIASLLTLRDEVLVCSPLMAGSRQIHILKSHGVLVVPKQAPSDHHAVCYRECSSRQTCWVVGFAVVGVADHEAFHLKGGHPRDCQLYRLIQIVAVTDAVVVGIFRKECP